MERRWVGLVVVIAVLVGGLVAGRLLGPGATGTPVAEPPPGPPAVGDCLLSREVLPFWTIDNPLADTPPAALIGTCDGARFGEVVSVVEGPIDRDGPELAPGCQAAADAWLGLPTTQVGAGVQWSVASLHTIMVSGPDPRQRAAGQGWATCLLSPGWDTIDLSASDEQVQVGRSLRSAYGDPDLRDRLSYCVDQGLGVIGNQIRCDRPHDTQAMGFSMLTTELARSEAEESCREWVAQLSGLDDPTDGGAIDIVITVYDYSTGNQVTAEQLQPDMSIDCSVTVAVDDDRRLTGSLLGLAGGPIPWA